jgi:tetratricopeptide (TPR) repeat protein
MIKRLPAVLAAIFVLANATLTAHAEDAPPTTAARLLAPEELFAMASPSVVLVEVSDAKMVPTGQGSGFFVSSDGLVVTNFHVINGASFVSVRRTDGSTCFVEGVAATDEKSDLALLKINSLGTPLLKLADPEPPKVGTRVFAIGNPLGMTNTLSEGLVSGVRKDPQQGTLIQTSAPYTHGSSGGPLLTADGFVVGVTSSGFDAANLNFAVSSAQVRSMITHQGKLQPLASASMSKLDPQDSRAFAEVLVAISRKQTSKAIALLNDLRERQGENPMFWFTSGCLHVQLGNHDIAADAFREAVRLKPDMVLAHTMLGNELFAMKKYNDALVAYKAAAKLKPSDASVYALAGDVFSAQGEWAEALKFYDRAIKLSREDASTWRNRGRALAMLDRKDEAMDCFNTATKIEPRSIQNSLYKADAYMKWKQYDEAGRMFRYVIAQAPNNAVAYFGLGCVDIVQKDFTGARTAFNNAIRFDPRGPIGVAARQGLDRLSGKSNVGGVASGQ